MVGQPRRNFTKMASWSRASEHLVNPIGMSDQLKWNNHSTKGADASASIFSLIETAKANRLNPFDYIEYILEIMPQIDIIQHPEKIDWFMPWSDQIKEEFGIKDD